MTPTPEQRVRQLILRGIMPSDAERIVAEVDAVGRRLMLPGERDAAAVVTEADQERARNWWLYSVDVPTKYKRILSARLQRA